MHIQEAVIWLFWSTAKITDCVWGCFVKQWRNPTSKVVFSFGRKMALKERFPRVKSACILATGSFQFTRYQTISCVNPYSWNPVTLYSQGQCHEISDFEKSKGNLSLTLIKKKIKFSSYIQSGAVANSYMRKSFLIYEEMRKYFPIYSMRRPLFIHDFANAPLRISLYMRKIWFSFLSVHGVSMTPVEYGEKCFNRWSFDMSLRHHWVAVIFPLVSVPDTGC